MRIGISARTIEVNGKMTYVLYKRYIELFSNHEIIIIMPGQSNEVIEMCDCFVLTGGDDIDPKFYGQDNTSSENINTDIDELDFRIIECAIKQNKKLLGICRGIQSINVFFNGTLKQHFEGHMDVEHEIYKCDKANTLNLPESFKVNSYHHQIIDQLGHGLKCIYKSSDDVIEIIEHDVYSIYGVQFHPEINILNDIYNNILNTLL